MTDPEVTVVQGELFGDPGERMRSTRIGDYDPVFTGLWFSERPGPRFGDCVWEITGTDPNQTRATWEIDFTGLSAEWSLTIREVLYWRANLRKIRSLASVSGSGSRYRDFRAGTIFHWWRNLRYLADTAGQLGIGLPCTWTEQSTDALRDYIVSERPNAILGVMVQALYQMRDVLSLGGLGHDPTRDYGAANKWAGDTAASRDAASEALPPNVFHSIVGNALIYVEQCAPDILFAREWREKRLEVPPRNMIGNQLSHDHPVRLRYQDVVSHRLLQLHNAMEVIGGVPTATVPRLGRDAYSMGDDSDVCQATLRMAAGLNLRKGGRLDHQFIRGRIAAGTPKVLGGLPVPVREIQRADGTTGPWRDPWCWQAIAVEEETLRHACHIVLAAFTAMRDGELARIPVRDWRTSWMGADAITAPLVKNAYGDAMKWWATPAVLRACEILEQLAEPDAKFLLVSRGRISRGLVSERGLVNAGSFVAMQVFIWRLNTDKHLHGFHTIDAGWRKAGSRKMTVDASKPTVSGRMFRFTLASISNFVALGDVAFQQQAKHAKIAMSHSYQANGGTDGWTATILNTLVNEEAEHRTAEAVDLYIGVWTGESDLAGHAGRAFTRTIRDLLRSLPIASFDPSAEAAEVEQFMTQVFSVPELAAAIKSTAQMFYPGTICHCLRYVQQMECTDKNDPVQGLCHPETCRNVLLDPLQQVVYRQRLDRTKVWLGIPGIPAQQRIVLENTASNLRAQLRKNGE